MNVLAVSGLEKSQAGSHGAASRTSPRRTDARKLHIISSAG